MPIENTIMTYKKPFHRGRAALISTYDMASISLPDRGENLFVYYSPTIAADVLLRGDDELLWWLSRVEMDPLVKLVDLHPEGYCTRIQPIAVLTMTGGSPTEVHYLSDDLKLEEISGKMAINQVPVIIRDLDLRKIEPIAMNYHSLFVYTGPIRNQAYDSEQAFISSKTQSMESGTLADLQQACLDIEPCVFFGLIGRLVAKGELQVELATGLSPRTRWKRRAP